jgi:hypothetical protein
LICATGGAYDNQQVQQDGGNRFSKEARASAKGLAQAANAARRARLRIQY